MKTRFSTAGIASGSARRPWMTLGIWLLVIILAGAVATQLRTTTEMSFVNDPDSARAEKLIEERLRADEPVTETVIVRSEGTTIESPAFRTLMDGIASDLLAMDGVVTGVTSYYDLADAGVPSGAGMIAADGRTALMRVELGTDLDAAIDNAHAYVDVVKGYDGGQFQVLTIGDASATEEIFKIAEQDLRTAELFGLPMALLVLVVVFGALVAAGVPILVGIVSIITAFGFAAGVSQVFELDFFITNMISMIGLAVGIDYALFIMERYREERRNGIDKLRSIEIAGGTAAKAVVFSGMTVIMALTGMFLIPISLFRGLATGAILAVLVAIFAALTLIPAILALLGDRIDWPRLRRRSSEPAAASGARAGFWTRITRAVMRRPVATMVIAVVILLALSAPLLDLQTGQTGIESLPESDVKTAFEIMREDFYVGMLSPVEIVVDGDASNPLVAAGIQEIAATLGSNGQFGATSIETNASGDLTVLSAPLATDSNAPESFAAIEGLRDQIIPQAFEGAPASVYVSGDTASMMDFNGILSTYMPIVFAFVLGLSFILLMLAFRSIVVPVMSIFMNLLSVGAAYGLLVLAFQHGWGSFLGLQHTPVIEAWIPVFLFCVLFGLSMDYHVFLLSRIREHYDLTGDNDVSVASGLQSTGKIITGAALIMVVVFGAFAAGRIVSLQQVGFGLAASVLLDATLVRSVLVPSMMKLLGDRNWYLPRRLSWLPNVSIEGKPDYQQLHAPALAAAGDD